MKTYLPLLLFFLLGTLSAQDALLFDESPSQTLVYRYQHLSGPAAPVVRQMLQAVAPPTGAPQGFELHYSYRMRILQQDQKLDVGLDWLSLQADQAPRVQGFLFDDLFLPTGVTFHLTLLANGRAVSTEAVTLAFGASLPGHHFKYGPIQGGVFYTLQVTDLHFQYAPAAVAAIQDRRRALTEYGAAKIELDYIHRELAQFPEQLPTPRELQDGRAKYDHLRGRFTAVQRAPFWTLLHLDAPQAHDPERLRALRDDCATRLQQIDAHLQHLAANVHLLYHQEGVAQFQRGRLRAARDAFEQALRTQGTFAPSHYYLAYLDFSEGRVEAAADRTRRVINQYNPDPTTDQDARALAADIIRFYFDSGQTAMTARRYPEAVDWYVKAKTYGQSIHRFPFGQQEADSRIQEALHYDYHDRLDATVALYRQKDYNAALNRLNDALAFQRTHRVPSTFDVRSLEADIVRDFYAAQLTNIRQLRIQQRWEDALRDIQQAARLAADYPGIVRDTQALDTEQQLVQEGRYRELYQLAEENIRLQKLDQALGEAQAARQFAQAQRLSATLLETSDNQLAKIQRLRYQRFVQGGDRAADQGQYDQALAQYAQARQLEVELPYLAGTSQLANKVKAAVLAQARNIQRQALQTTPNDNAALTAARRQIADLAARHQLGADPALQPLFAAIDDRVCDNVRTQILPAQERLLAQQQAASDYTAARNTLDNIQKLWSDYPACNATPNPQVLQQEATIRACAAYQETLQDAILQEQRQQYTRAIAQYRAAARRYDDPQVRTRLAGHPAFDLYPYLANHPQYRMALAGVDAYLEQRDVAQALQLLRTVITQGAPIAATEGTQQRVGTVLAAQSYVRTASWKEAFYTHIPKSERKPYQAMYKAFKQKWKAM